MAPLSAQVTGKSWPGDHGDGGNGSWSTPENWNPAEVPAYLATDNGIANFYLNNGELDAIPEASSAMLSRVGFLATPVLLRNRLLS